MSISDGGWEFHLGGRPPKTPDIQENNEDFLPFLASEEQWANYSDDDIYEFDTNIRAWIQKNQDTDKWKIPKPIYRRFTARMAFEEIYGREYDQEKDGSTIYKFSKVLAYYSSRISKGGSIRGWKTSKKIYYISISRFKKVKPYSLRIRLEQMEANGEIPTWRNMRLPKDDLKAGHARNPRTDANMERRREKAREIYNERYNRNSKKQETL